MQTQAILKLKPFKNISATKIFFEAFSITIVLAVLKETIQASYYIRKTRLLIDLNHREYIFLRTSSAQRFKFF